MGVAELYNSGVALTRGSTKQIIQHVATQTLYLFMYLFTMSRFY